jgi:cytoskeletal protein CcmA (bactofilin family)
MPVPSSSISKKTFSASRETRIVAVLLPSTGVRNWQPGGNSILPQPKQLPKLKVTFFITNSFWAEHWEVMTQNEKDTQRGLSATPSAPSSIGRTTSYLGPGLRINGEITGNEDLKLDSNVDGLVSIGGFRLTVGPSAHLNADVVAREAVISGEVNGNISACDRIDIMKSASIVGDLSTGRITIEEGAYFKGGVEIDSRNTQIGTDLDTLLKGAKNAKER